IDPTPGPQVRSAPEIPERSGPRPGTRRGSGTALALGGPRSHRPSGFSCLWGCCLDRRRSRTPSEPSGAGGGEVNRHPVTAIPRRNRSLPRGTMAPLLTSEPTSFTLDNQGRFLCNTLQEALDSASQDVAGRRRDFDVIVIGGGAFGSVIAEHLFINDTTRSRRILVLEAGPYVLPEHVQNMPFLGGAPDMRVPWLNHPALNYLG